MRTTLQMTLEQQMPQVCLSIRFSYAFLNRWRASLFSVEPISNYKYDKYSTNFIKCFSVSTSFKCNCTEYYILLACVHNYERTIPTEPCRMAISIYFLKSSYDLCMVGRVKMEKHVSAIGNLMSPSWNLTCKVALHVGKWFVAIQKHHKSVNVGLPK